MEQKRTLWIVAAVGVFLLVVVGAALILYSPALNQEQYQGNYNPAEGWVNANKNDSVAPIINSTQDQVSTLKSEEFDSQTTPLSPFESKQEETLITTEKVEQEKYAQNSTIKAENITVYTDNTMVYGTPETTTIDLNTLKSNPQLPQTSIVVPKNDYTASQMTTTQNVVKKEVPTTNDSYYAPVKKVEKQNTSVKKTETKVTSKKVSKPKKTVEKVTVQDSFWIQVGSYEQKKSADNARSVLEANKIPNEVFTYKNSLGKLFYRVRVGPYTTKSEAEYWLSRILLINEFAETNSYVVNANGKKQ